MSWEYRTKWPKWALSVSSLFIFTLFALSFLSFYLQVIIQILLQGLVVESKCFSVSSISFSIPWSLSNDNVKQRNWNKNAVAQSCSVLILVDLKTEVSPVYTTPSDSIALNIVVRQKSRRNIVAPLQFFQMLKHCFVVSLLVNTHSNLLNTS